MFDIQSTVSNWLEDKQTVALATVVKTWGSAPRQAGAKMGITADASIIGSVSGGCVEAAVIQEALDSLDDHQPRLLDFGVSDDTAWDVGLACGGQISVLVEPLDQTWFSTVQRHLTENNLIASAVVLAGQHAGAKILINGQGELLYASDGITSEVQAALIVTIEAVLDAGEQSQRVMQDEFDILVDVHRLRPRLVIIGGAHAAIALQDIAYLLGFRVILIDPRQAFATDARFPHAESILHSYPDKALAQIGIDSETYLAVLTHDPKIDDPALITALPQNVPYVGVLSSSRTHQKRITRLKDAGLTEEQITKIRTPIGIDIGAQTPEEIALCIMAEIVAVRNGVL